MRQCRTWLQEPDQRLVIFGGLRHAGSRWRWLWFATMGKEDSLTRRPNIPAHWV